MSNQSLQIASLCSQWRASLHSRDGHRGFWWV